MAATTTTPTRRTLYYYDDYGASAVSTQMLRRSLERYAAPRGLVVAPLRGAEVARSDWRQTAAAIALGGGFDLGFIDTLGAEGQRQLRCYVDGGGRYVGLCAGAYFAADWVDFDCGGALEVVGPRRLGFFPGRAVGPLEAYPGFAYGSDTGMHAVPVEVRLGGGREGVPVELPATYYNGGCHFVHQPTDHGDSATGCASSCAEVVGTYADGKAAIVRCAVGGGGGAALLSGVHLEWSVLDSELLASSVKKKDGDSAEISPAVREKYEAIMRHAETTERVFYSLLDELLGVRL